MLTVKADMVFAGNTVWSISECVEALDALYKSTLRLPTIYFIADEAKALTSQFTSEHKFIISAINTLQSDMHKWRTSIDSQYEQFMSTQNTIILLSRHVSQIGKSPFVFFSSPLSHTATNQLHMTTIALFSVLIRSLDCESLQHYS